MQRWDSPRVHEEVALSISPPRARKGISGPWQGASCDGTMRVTSSCDPSVPIDSQRPGTKAGEVFPD